MPATRLILVIIANSERSFNVFNAFTSAGYKLYRHQFLVSDAGLSVVGLILYISYITGEA